MRKWVNWEETLKAIVDGQLLIANGQRGDGGAESAISNLQSSISNSSSPLSFDLFDQALKLLYADFTLERAAAEAQVPVERLRECAGNKRASAASSLRPAQLAGMAVTAGL